MTAKPTKVYPIRDRYIVGVPTAVHVVDTQGEADDLIASGAFTDDPKHPDRDHAAVDLTAEDEPEPKAAKAKKVEPEPDTDAAPV